MTELLSGIRVIKFFRWEQALGDRVKAHRTRELGRLRVVKYLDAVCVYLWAALPVVIFVAIFITYVLMGHQLTATKVRAVMKHHTQSKWGVQWLVSLTVPYDSSSSKESRNSVRAGAWR